MPNCLRFYDVTYDIFRIREGQELKYCGIPLKVLRKDHETTEVAKQFGICTPGKWFFKL